MVLAPANSEHYHWSLHLSFRTSSAESSINPTTSISPDEVCIADANGETSARGSIYSIEKPADRTVLKAKVKKEHYPQAVQRMVDPKRPTGRRNKMTEERDNFGDGNDHADRGISETKGVE